MQKKDLRKLLSYKLQKKVNPDNVIYRNKGSTADVKFNEFGNALNLLDKTKEDKINLADEKNYQIGFESNLGKIKKEAKI